MQQIELIEDASLQVLETGNDRHYRVIYITITNLCSIITRNDRPLRQNNGNDIAELVWLEEKLKFKCNTRFGSLNHFGQNVLH
mgnify:CR=1 FL=1